MFEPAEKGSRKVIVSTNIAEVHLKSFIFTLRNIQRSALGKCHHRGNQVRGGFRFRQGKEDLFNATEFSDEQADTDI